MSGTYKVEPPEGHEVLRASGIGTEWVVTANSGSFEASFSVYVASGPACLREAERLSWEAACDLVRDRIGAEVRAEMAAEESFARGGSDRPVAKNRAETDPCERGTVGCCIDHSAEQGEQGIGSECETW